MSCQSVLQRSVSLILLRSMRRTVRKSLLEEVQELEAQAVDPGAAVLRDASSRRYGRRRDFDAF